MSSINMMFCEWNVSVWTGNDILQIHLCHNICNDKNPKWLGYATLIVLTQNRGVPLGAPLWVYSCTGGGLPPRDTKFLHLHNLWHISKNTTVEMYSTWIPCRYIPEEYVSSLIGLYKNIGAVFSWIPCWYLKIANLPELWMSSLSMIISWAIMYRNCNTFFT